MHISAQSLNPCRTGSHVVFDIRYAFRNCGLLPLGREIGALDAPDAIPCGSVYRATIKNSHGDAYETTLPRVEWRA